MNFARIFEAERVIRMEDKQIIKIEKIQRFGAAMILAGAIINYSVFSVKAQCKRTNHSYRNCTIGKFLEHIPTLNKESNLGIEHRIAEIKKDPRVVDVRYGNITVDKYDYSLPLVTKNGNSEMYVAPNGFRLVRNIWSSDGLFSCESVEPVDSEDIGLGYIVNYQDGKTINIVVEPYNEMYQDKVIYNSPREEYNKLAIVEYQEDEIVEEPQKIYVTDGKTTSLVAPFGYTLETIDGKVKAVKRVLKPVVKKIK